jgi:hypothetical protein
VQELIDKIVEKVGIDRQLAEQAVGIILGMIKSEGDEDDVGELISKLPGAGDLIGKASDSGAGPARGLGGLISGALAGGNPVMKTLSKLQSEGLDMRQSQSIGLEVLDFAKEKAGEELVKRVTESIPGLSALI